MVLTLDGPEPAPDVVSNTELGWAANLFPKSCGGRNRGLSLRIISPSCKLGGNFAPHCHVAPPLIGYGGKDPCYQRLGRSIPDHKSLCYLLAGRHPLSWRAGTV